MRDAKVIQELEAQLACDRKMLTNLRKREAELLCHVSHKGFCTEAERKHLLCETQVLQSSIQKNQLMLAMARR